MLARCRRWEGATSPFLPPAGSFAVLKFPYIFSETLYHILANLASSLCIFPPPRLLFHCHSIIFYSFPPYAPSLLSRLCPSLILFLLLFSIFFVIALLCRHPT
ncbi:hypothetical protein GGI43DRAFT_412878 [Trichoderma evansii]